MKSTCRLDVTMPPMLGAAIGFMISMPAPLANITGFSPSNSPVPSLPGT